MLSHPGSDGDHDGDLHRQVPASGLVIPSEKPLEHGVHLHNPLISPRHVRNRKLRKNNAKRRDTQFRGKLDSRENNILYHTGS